MTSMPRSRIFDKIKVGRGGFNRPDRRWCHSCSRSTKFEALVERSGHGWAPRCAVCPCFGGRWFGFPAPPRPVRSNQQGGETWSARPGGFTRRRQRRLRRRSVFRFGEDRLADFSGSASARREVAPGRIQRADARVRWATGVELAPFRVDHPGVPATFRSPCRFAASVLRGPPRLKSAAAMAADQA